MRVLWITHVYPRNSDDLQGLFLHRLAKELPKRGVELRVLAPCGSGGSVEEVRDGVKITRFRYPGVEGMPLAYTGEMHRVAMRHPIRFGMFVRAMLIAARGEIRQFAPEIVHAHWWFPSGFVCRQVTPREQFKLVVSLHGTDVRLLARNPFARPVARWVLRDASLVLPVSESLLQWMQRAQLEARRWNVLPMPADDTVFVATAIPEQPPHSFVVPARLVTQKRIDLALRGLQWAVERGVDAVIQIVGEGELRRDLEQLTKELSLTERVTFHGFVNQQRLAELFGQSLAIVLPSVEEGYGLVLVEASLCGRPSIGARSGAIRDWIENDVTGILVESEDSVGFGMAIERLARDPSLARRMGLAGLERARARTAQPLSEILVSEYAMVVKSEA